MRSLSSKARNSSDHIWRDLPRVKNITVSHLPDVARLVVNIVATHVGGLDPAANFGALPQAVTGHDGRPICLIAPAHSVGQLQALVPK
jgi:hypothetical protein